MGAFSVNTKGLVSLEANTSPGRLWFVYFVPAIICKAVYVDGWDFLFFFCIYRFFKHATTFMIYSQSYSPVLKFM